MWHSTFYSNPATLPRLAITVLFMMLSNASAAGSLSKQRPPESVFCGGFKYVLSCQSYLQELRLIARISIRYHKHYRSNYCSCHYHGLCCCCRQREPRSSRAGTEPDRRVSDHVPSPLLSLLQPSSLSSPCSTLSTTDHPPLPPPTASNLAPSTPVCS